MIVVDTNVIAYLMIPGDVSKAAKAALRADPEWAAPLLWRSEFRNVLALYMRQEELQLSDALDVLDRASQLLKSREFAVPDRSVMELVALSGCSAYDCEFVALAQELEVPLVTSDRRILGSFPQRTKDIAEFISQS